ncbi:putative oxidoreductase [Vitis vinifera]|uniref:Putative oxidoreductase n=1 Tax=Vitis vinifera TaxID=29760 RepID=A0A438CSY6_VITVI|nr:putative oxidoreductase [Vitis vinifera]
MLNNSPCPYHLVQSCFTYLATSDFHENNIRVKPDLDALGALGDVGWYCIRAILFAVDYELPKSVKALPGTVFNEAGVLTSCGASLLWEDGKVATFNCSFQANLTMNITAIGTKGTLQVQDFVIPVKEDSAAFSAGIESWFNDLVTGWKTMPSEHVVTTDLPQEALMVKEFSGLVADIKRNGSKLEQKWPTLSRKTQLVLDAVKVSIERGLEPVEL